MAVAAAWVRAHSSQQELFLCSVAWFPPDPAAGLAKALGCLASSVSPQVLLIVSESPSDRLLSQLLKETQSQTLPADHPAKTEP